MAAGFSRTAASGVAGLAELLRFAAGLVAGFAFAAGLEAAGLAAPFAFEAAAGFFFAVPLAAAGLAEPLAPAAGAVGAFAFAVSFEAAGLVEDFRVVDPATAREGLADLESPGCSEPATVTGFLVRVLPSADGAAAAAFSPAPDMLRPCFAPSRPVVSAMIYVPVVLL